MLQWGRVRLNAETSAAVQGVAAFSCASMGPRSVERGNQEGGRARCGFYVTLQWGRVRLNAETRG